LYFFTALFEEASSKMRKEKIMKKFKINKNPILLFKLCIFLIVAMSISAPASATLPTWATTGCVDNMVLPQMPQNSIPVTIDGIISAGEWGDAAKKCEYILKDIDSNNYYTAQLRFKHDGVNLYILLLVDGPGFTNDAAKIYFFKQAIEGVGEFLPVDAIMWNYFSSLHFEDRFYLNPNWVLDISEGGSANGNCVKGGVYNNSENYTVYEFAHPLKSGDVHDFSLTPPSTISFATYLTFTFLSGQTTTIYTFRSPGLIDTLYINPPADPCAGHGGDTDGDGICDDVDNCPNTYNPDQKDSDGDGIGDVCDNCPSVFNPDQLDRYGLGKGDACSGVADEIHLSIAPLLPETKPGEPIWITTTFKFEDFKSQAPCINIVKPTCFNVFHAVEIPGSGPVEPGCILGPPVVWQTDIIPICRGQQVSVTCDISERYPFLLPGDYNITGYYNNYLKYDPYIGCGNFNCVADVLLGTVASSTDPPTTHKILDLGSTPPVAKTSISFNPDSWDIAWKTVKGNSPPISAKISDIHAGTATYTTPYTVDNVDVSTIRLNGFVRIIPGSERIVDDALYVQFNRADAMASQTGVSGNTVFPRITGKVKTKDPITNVLISKDFVAEKPVLIVEDTGTAYSIATLFTVGCGSKPHAFKTPIAGMEIRIYDESPGSCAASYRSSWKDRDDIWNNCSYTHTQETYGQGEAIFALPRGSYLMIGKSEVTDAIWPPHSDFVGSPIHIYPGSKERQYFQIIEMCDKKKVPGKCTIFTGSELVVIEPEYVEWSSETELYPFVFDSVGDWTVTTSITPPEGFVSDNTSLKTNVNNEVEAVQFTITDVGSKWVPTKVKHKIKHKDHKEINFDSEVGIKLSHDKAKKKGIGIYGEDDPGKGKK
jgi:hypothetical protein